MVNIKVMWTSRSPGYRVKELHEVLALLELNQLVAVPYIPAMTDTKSQSCCGTESNLNCIPITLRIT